MLFPRFEMDDGYHTDFPAEKADVLKAPSKPSVPRKELPPSAGIWRHLGGWPALSNVIYSSVGQRICTTSCQFAAVSLMDMRITPRCRHFLICPRR